MSKKRLGKIIYVPYIQPAKYDVKLSTIHLLLLFFGCVFVSEVNGQIMFNTDNDPETLVQEFLLGSGVLISNVSYTGLDSQIGGFDDPSWGLNQGLVLSTGEVLSLNPDGLQNFNPGMSGNADLLAVANSVPALIGQNFALFSVEDVAFLEFDFIPYEENFEFSFVFASSEYPEYVNSAFNDVFAFFLSGPGIEGPYSSPAGFDGSINIAVVPESDPPLPITISSVNDILNSEYYIPLENFDDVNYMNGSTTLLTAGYEGLQIGETYHIRFGIADGSDSAFDSIVMLQEGSFTAFESVEIGAEGDFDSDGDIDVDDLLTILGELGCMEECITDLNGDGLVNVLDILDFLELF